MTEEKPLKTLQDLDFIELLNFKEPPISIEINIKNKLKTQAIKWGKNMIKKYGNCFEVEDFFNFFNLDLNNYLLTKEDLK